MTEAKKAIRSLIFGKFETETKCAESMGWNRQRLNRIVNGKKEPTVSEVVAIAEALGVQIDLVANIFLRMQSPNG